MRHIENTLFQEIESNPYVNFWTLFIVLIFKTRRFGDWLCLRPQVNKIRGGSLLGPLPVFYPPEDGDISSL
jgi:hypothetical protein